MRPNISEVVRTDVIVANFELEFPNSTELDLERKCGEMSSDVLELLVDIKIYRVKGKIQLIWVIIDPLISVFYWIYF